MQLANGHRHPGHSKAFPPSAPIPFMLKWMLVIVAFIFRASANASQANSVGPTSCEALWDLVGTAGLAALVSDNTPKDEDAGDATIDPQSVG